MDPTLTLPRRPRKLAVKPSLPCTFPSPLFFLALLGASSCVSTETGNPTQDPPGPDAPIEGTPVALNVGLRGSPQMVDVPGVPSGTVSALWLHIADVDLITCAGKSLSSASLMAGQNLATNQALTVVAPDEEICALVVRTSPLSLTAQATLPPGGVGQGAILEGIDAGGTPFSVTIPQRITTVLTPLSPGLLLSQATALQLKVEDAELLVSIPAAPSGVTGGSGNNYDSENAPEIVDGLAQSLRLAFSLESGEGTARQVLATSAETWSDIDSLLCVSECASQDRTSCLETACDEDACMNQLLSPACGESFRSALYCRVGLSPEEYSCLDGALSVSASHCASADSTYRACGE